MTPRDGREKRARGEGRKQGRERLAYEGRSHRVELEHERAERQARLQYPGGSARCLGSAQRAAVGDEQPESHHHHHECREDARPAGAGARRGRAGVGADSHAQELTRRRWKRLTARLWAASVSLNSWLPSLRLTK